MKKKTLLILMTGTLLAASLFSGCGKKDTASPADEVVEVEEADADADDPGDTKDREDSATEGEDVDEDTVETPAEAIPDPNAPRAEDMEVTEETKSEGLNAVPGAIVELKEDAVKGVLGETYEIPAENPHFSLTVRDIGLTDKLTSDQEASRVVRISYTYNNHDLEYLMIGQYSFKMLDKDGNACQIYYFNPENDDEVNMMPVEAGQSYDAAVGFILPDDSDKCTVIYDDLTGISDTEITWEMIFEN